MRVGILQFDIVWEDHAANRERIGGLLAKAAGSGPAPDWLVLPEMTLSGFSMDPARTSLLDEDVRFFGDLAQRQQAFVTYGGVVQGRNCAVTVDRAGGIVNEYAKVHLFAVAGETGRYAAGEQASSFGIDGLRVTPLVCYDLRFPYLFWDRAADTDAYVVIASWPAQRAAHWRSLLQARAIENQAWVIGVNRVGTDPKNSYAGGSLVVDPLGKVVLDCGDLQGLFVHTLDARAVRETRDAFPFQRDRRR